MNVCKKCGEVKGHNENCPFCEEDKIKIVDYFFPNNDENFMEVTLDLNGYIFIGELKSKELVEREELKSIKDIEPKSSDEIWFEYENSDRNVNWFEERRLKAEAVKWIKEDLRNPDHDEREIKKWMNRLNISKEDLEEK